MTAQLLQSILSMDKRDISKKRNVSKSESYTECSPIGDLKPFTFPCPFGSCQEQFNVRATLYYHIKEHWDHGDDRQCETCDKDEFRNLGKLVEHVWACSQVRPYICPLRGCSFAAAQKGNLKKHLQRMHQFSFFSLTSFKYSMSRLAVCSISILRETVGADLFKRILSVDIQQHQTTNKKHSKPKLASESVCAFDIEALSFPCIFEGCKEQFNIRKRLCEHIHEHIAGNEDMRCRTCDRRDFDDIHNLLSHAWACSNIGPYVCPFRSCKYTAAQKSNLKKHLQKAHQFSSTFILCTEYLELSSAKLIVSWCICCL